MGPQLIIASGNPVKVAEIEAMLSPLDVEVRLQPGDLDVEETGATYLENASLKAVAAAHRTNDWALADDSGLEVDGLQGAPGLFSARYGNTDAERIQRLLKELGDSPYRSASFNSAVAVADPNGTIRLEAQGICRGEILTAPQGGGCGYDSVFWVREAGCTYAQLNSHQLSKLGSRGRAMRQIAAAMRKLLRF